MKKLINCMISLMLLFFQHKIIHLEVQKVLIIFMYIYVVNQTFDFEFKKEGE